MTCIVVLWRRESPEQRSDHALHGPMNCEALNFSVITATFAPPRPVRQLRGWSNGVMLSGCSDAFKT